MATRKYVLWNAIIRLPLNPALNVVILNDNVLKIVCHMYMYMFYYLPEVRRGKYIGCLGVFLLQYCCNTVAILPSCQYLKNTL